RRSRASSKMAKGRRRKAEMPKRGAAPTLRIRSSGQESELRRERDEALERETATSEVLRIISNSPTDLQSALGAIAESAARLLDVAGAEISRIEGDGLRLMAKHGSLPQRLVGSIRPINRHWVTGRSVVDRTTVQVPDLQAAESEFPEGAASARQYGHRTTLATPLLREGNPIGAILIRRMEVRPFTDKQIALLQNFAAQAVIAIENARLLNELRQRTSDLTESLEQQTATSEVLKVISSSPGDLQPVFQTILANATRICEAKFGMLFRVDGENFKFAAEVGTPPEFAEFERQRGPFTPTPGMLMDRCVRTKQVCRIDDYAAETFRGHSATLGKARSTFAVPMLKDEMLIGVIIIYRQEVRPFTDKQIELVQNFAAQAVIAIENARLLNELQQSLEQQTATADVLKVISRSTVDLQSVLDTLVEAAARLCGADMAHVATREGEVYRSAARFAHFPELDALARHVTFTRDRGTVVGRVAIERRVIQVADIH